MLSIFFVFSCAIVGYSVAQFDPTQHENWKLLENRNCAGSTGSRITGGVQALLGEFPWIAGLVLSRPDGQENKYGCGGTIINKRTILTAAHCVTFLEGGAKVSKVVVGDWSKDTDPDCDNGVCGVPVQTIEAKEIIFHSKFFKPYPRQFDIALIRLAKDIEFNSYIWPICMLNGVLFNSKFLYTEVVAAGWGVSDPNVNRTSTILRKVKLEVQDGSLCEDPNLNYVFGDNQLCAGGKAEGVGICVGDSGGPLMLVEAANPAPRTYIIGIASFNQGACGATVPSIFTRVSSFVEWILDNLVENKNNFIAV